MAFISKNILYLEDDMLIANSFTKVLALYFEKVIHVPNGVEGLKKYHEERFDLILSDIDMPEMDGIKFINNIRQIDQQIPIYVLSSLPKDFINIEHCYVTQYFQKPTGLKEFLQLFPIEKE